MMATTAASRGTYQRERVRMTAATLARAARIIRDGTIPGRGTEFLDTDTAGLTLRVTRQSGTWYLRHRKATIRLGSMDAMNLPAAREAASRARRDVELGVDPRIDVGIFERQVAKGASLDFAIDVAFAPSEPMLTEAERRKRGPWQWGDLTEEFLAAKVSALKEGYGPKYSAYHRGPEFDEIRGREIASLDIGELEALRDRVVESRTVSAAARVVRQNKEMLSWAWSFHSTRSGLSEVLHPWWDRWGIQYKSGTREHTPTVTELVRTLLMAEHHVVLASTTQQTGPGMLAALWAVVLTAQRTGPLSSTRREAIIPFAGRPGWEVWTWTGKQMKGGKNGGRPHGLPIPPAAVAAIARCGADTDSPFLFPSRVEGKPIYQSGLNQMFYRLQGKEKPGKGDAVTKRGRDLFAAYGIRVWTPHDARRSLATFLDDEELGGAGSAIIAHSKGKGTEEQQIEDITRRVYAKAQRLDLKAKGMEAWVAHVLAAYDREKARFKVLA